MGGAQDRGPGGPVGICNPRGLWESLFGIL